LDLWSLAFGLGQSIKAEDQSPIWKNHVFNRTLITVADLEKYPDDDGNRYELIEGELFVSTAPGLPHQFVLQNLQVALVNFLRKNPIGRVVPGAGAVFSNFDAVIPDLVFVSNERWSQIVANDRFNAAPEIVIEVLSHGAENQRRDLMAKHRLYHNTAFKNIGLSIRRINWSCCIDTPHLTK